MLMLNLAEQLEESSTKFVKPMTNQNYRSLLKTSRKAESLPKELIVVEIADVFKTGFQKMGTLITLMESMLDWA